MPSSVWPHKGVVRRISVSPSGAMVAAIVDYYSPTLSASVYPAELIVWCAGADVDCATSPLHWLCLGSVHLQTGSENRPTAGKSQIGWTHEESLLLAVPVVAGCGDSDGCDSDVGEHLGVRKSSFGCLISVTNWEEVAPVSRSGENKKYVATRAKASGGIDMPGILAPLPFFTEIISGMIVATWSEKDYLRSDETSSNRSSTVRVLFWAGKKICMFEVNTPVAIGSSVVGRQGSSPSINLLWTDVSLMQLCCEISSYYYFAGYWQSRAIHRAFSWLAYRLCTLFLYTRKYDGGRKIDDC